MQILLVEDDELLGDGVCDGLTQFGYVVEWVKDGQVALDTILAKRFDTIVLDLGLPKRPGINVLKAMRAKHIETPVLILTANDSVESRIKGLDSGADDYLVKPFDLEELCARIRALHRRTASRLGAPITHGKVMVDPSTRSVYIDGEPLLLPRREFVLLQKLLENAGRILSRDQLNQALYTWDDEIDSNALEVHIHNLRRKIGFTLVRTIRGVGYMIDKPK